MSQILNEVLAANERYAATFGGKAILIIPPARHFAVLTCMDARLDPAKFAGLAEGDPHSSATPAAASEDAIRSLVVSYKLLRTREWFIIHHTDCGMEFFTNKTIPELLEKSLETARLTDSGWVDVGYELGSSARRGIDWSTFEDARA